MTERPDFSAVPPQPEGVPTAPAASWAPPTAPAYGAAGYGVGAPMAPRPVFDPAQITSLPIDERTHPFFYRTPTWAWWRPIVALLLTAFLTLIVMSVPGLVGLLADGADFEEMARTGEVKIGPWGFLGNNIGLALCIPVAMLMQWAFFNQRPKWLSSVTGGFRWRWFGLCVAICLPIWLVMIVVEYALTGLPPDLGLKPYTWLMVAGILLTTPFQAAGEEYLMRGFEQRLVASYFKAEVVGLVVATLLSSLTFMALHGAGDPWLNLFYFVFGASACWLTWRTGGLEAAVAVHVVNNVLSEALMPFSDFSGMFNRQAGVADASVLILIAVQVAATVLLAYVAHRRGVVRRAAPGRAELDAAYARAQSAWGPVGSAQPG